MMKRFEVGKAYAHGWAGDAELFSTWRVLARTACTITLQEEYSNGRKERPKLCRINKRDSEYFKAEAVRPFGTYSMCPILTAEKETQA